MKKKHLRRGMKVINILVTVFMVVQPVGTPSLLGAYLAMGQTATDAQPASSDSGQADSTNAPDPAKDESGSKTDPTGSGSATDSTNTGSSEPSTDSSGGNTGVGDTNPADTNTPADTSQSDPTPTAPSDTPAPDDTSSTAPVTDANNGTPDSGTISPDAAATDTNTIEENGKICLKDGASITESVKSDWDVSGDTAETKGKVELGVKYVFPGDDKVSVTFTCLPASSADRTTLKIQQINSADINLPDGVSAATDFAYDITTGMKDGDFKYDLTLPKSDVAGADINYIEKTANEVKSQDITASDLKSVDNSKVKTETNEVKVSELDHFTIFIVTYPNNSYTIGTEKTSYQRGETVFVHATVSGADANKYYRLAINPPTGGGRYYVADCQNVAAAIDGSYALPIDATTSSNWKAEIRSYSDSSCSWNGSSTVGSSNFTVTEAVALGASAGSGGNPSADIDQCANGKFSAPSSCTGSAWQNGDLNINNSHYREGDSVPYRIKLKDLTAGQNYSVTISWDVTKSNKHAIDYLTDFNETESAADPCSGLIGGESCGLTHNNYSIPTDPTLGSSCGFIGTQIPGQFDLYGGDITSLNPSYSLSSCAGSDSSNTITINFTAEGRGAVLAWGGHIGSQVNWGLGNSAVNISGSPYHTAQSSCSFGCGQQDRSLKASAVLPTPDMETQVDYPSSIYLGQSVTDTATLTGSNGIVTGSVDFFVCGPGTPNPDCTLDGTKVGGSVALSGGQATSAQFKPYAVGNYCFRAEYTPDASAQYSPQNHTDLTNECFSVSPPPTGTLKVIKHVVNDNGGTNTASDFTLHVESGSSDVSGSPATGSETGVSYTLAPGAYTVSENAPLTGYTQTGFSGDCNSGGSVTVVASQEKTCTINNDDNAPSLTLNKIVINNNGGTASESAWTLTADGAAAGTLSGPGAAGSADVVSGVTFKAGTYTLSESGGPSGYTASVWTCTNGVTVDGNSQITLSLGQSTVCSITNDDIAPQLIVIKHVDISHGGTAVAADFTLDSGGTNDTPDNFPGAEAPGTTVTLDAGSYDVTETGPSSGYDDQYSADCSGSIDIGQTKTCTVTNSDLPGTLTVIKHVESNHSGNADASDFTMNITGINVKPNNSFPGSGAGISRTLDAGAYSVSESNLPDGYKFESATGCSGTMINGGSATCTITNEDIAPKLTLIKDPTNDDGGNAAPDDFLLTIGGNPATSGTPYTLDANTPYAIDETMVTGYEFVSITGDEKCPAALGGTITLDEGDDITCTITNDDIAPKLTLVKSVDNGDGGNAAPDEFLLTVGGTGVLSGVENTYAANTPLAIDETLLTGYEFVSITGAGCPAALGDTITLNEGDDITCTITNDDQQSYIIIDKTVVNDNGGSAAADDFKLTVDGNAALDEVKFPVNPGTYTAGETNLPGYTEGTWGTDCDEEGEVTVALGETKTCTITNDDQQSYITVVKTVTNDDGGSAAPDDFDLTLEGAATTSGTAVPVNPGTYTAGETLLPGYTFDGFSGGCDTNGDVAVALGESKTCTLTNNDIAPTLTLVKSVINDDGGTATADDWFLGITGVAFGQGPTLGPVTVSAGADYVISEAPGGPAGYTASTWSCDNGIIPQNNPTDAVVNLPLDKNVTCAIINDDVAPKLTLVKTVANDDGGTKQVADFPLFIDGNSVVSGVENTLTSNTLYTATETADPGYAASQWGGDCAADGTITLAPGDNKTCTITNDDIPGTVTVTKFEDTDENGFFDQSESALSGWSINLNPISGQTSPQTTDANGQVIFSDLTAGNLTLSETIQPGWEQTNIYCLFDREKDGEFDGLTDGVQALQPVIDNNYPFSVLPGENISCYIGNHFTPPSLQISKSNNKFPVDQAPGSDVTYTLTVTALDNDVNTVTVTDLPPAGFVYRNGSWTANSSVRGDIKNSPTTEPTYASPGDWNLGDMKKDEVVTLTYVADISAEQESGSYPDLAWTRGISLLNQDVLGEGTSSQFVDGPFVGTEVAVVRTGIVKGASVKIATDTDTEHKKRKTVRKTVILPATGASPWWLALAVIILLAGAGFLIAGKRKKKEDNPDDTNNMNSDMTKLLIAGLIGLSALFGVKAAKAATTLAAKMETPKSPYNTTDFNLGFVALDINGNPVTVQCFLNGPATPFQTVNLAGGGTSGNCNVNSSVIGGDGTYQFHITATNGSESVTTADVSVEVITGGPGTPTHYNRDKISNCQYKITFDTANDGGKTVKVELYRSTQRSYTADASTKVDELAIGSNQAGSFTATKPNCADTYYYVVRAFDALGNGSGVVGDTRTVTVTTGGGTTTITTNVAGAIPAGGAVAGIAAGGAAAGGAVAGEETAPAGEEQAAPGAEEGVVLGEEKAEEPQSFIQKNKVLSAVIALVILGIIYYAFIRKKKPNFPEPPQNPTGQAPPTV